MMKAKASRKSFALCVDNAGYQASLIPGKVYCILPDPRVARDAWYWCHLLGGTLRGIVIPAKAGIHYRSPCKKKVSRKWIPAFAGMTTFARSNDTSTLGKNH